MMNPQLVMGGMATKPRSVSINTILLLLSFTYKLEENIILVHLKPS